MILFIYFINQNQHMHSSSTGMDHDQVHIPEGYLIPSVEILVQQDQSATWLLKLEVKNFEFAPEKVGDNLESYNEGHAHLFINGIKINRLYGEYYNLGSLKPGEKEIKVSLHSNNHGALVVKGNRIEDSTLVKVPSFIIK
ncbi:hypothetical protein [Aquibacillus halophilus]|uniref:hypothetical protein n=1 Tax=Aquibacillus halophilus TaxID=930132 RepID=UPI00196A39E6|nr:hypothetical protein [Aquibacillus halophilus]